MEAGQIVCIYCQKNHADNSEHVFPKGLGGADVYMDCVCSSCNAMFSELERELIRNSVLALVRSVEKVEGYKSKKLRQFSITYPEIFQFVEADQILYEVGIYDGLKPYIRPQFIQVRGEIYLEASSSTDLSKFANALRKWRKENNLLIVHFQEDKNLPIEAISFYLRGGKYQFAKTTVAKSRNNILLYLLSSEHGFWEYLEPRLFYDETKNLILRCRTLDEGLSFVVALLDKIEARSNFKSFPSAASTDIVNVSFGFNVVKVQRALVKIGLNILAHYNPSVRNMPMLRPVIEYINDGVTPAGMTFNLENRTASIDIAPNTHSIYYIQHLDYVVVEMNLFEGSFTFTFTLPHFNLSSELDSLISALIVDYKSKSQVYYQNKDELIRQRLLSIIAQHPTSR